jgi:hypothetical protein
MDVDRKRRQEIASGGVKNFAAVLDDLFVASQSGEEAGPNPSISFDYLAIADELHSGRIKVSGATFDAEYREYCESAADLAAEFSAFLDQATPALIEAAGQVEETLPPVDPESIAAELGLGRSGGAADFGQLRRSFAFSNHPDRVAPHLRQRAMVRMQVANMLIDDAKRKALAPKRR